MKKKLKFKNTKTIEVSDWDKLVQETYGKPYRFQQQDGCQSRGTHTLQVPLGDIEDFDFQNDSIKDEVNGSEMGVSFKAWLARDPKEWNGEDGGGRSFSVDLFWSRNFYPNLQVLANDLYEKGLIEEGEYVINIDW